MEIRNKHIYLIGFMGSGKSTIGNQLADALSRPFLDTDVLIEQLTERAIPDTFKSHGEAYFRKLETEIVEKAAEDSPAVIALGGGAFTIQRNRDIVSQASISIYLKWTTDTLFIRLKESRNRPLLYPYNADELYAYIEDLLNSRKAFYEMADIIIEGESYESESALVQAIIEKLGTDHD